MIAILHNIRSQHNVGSIFRTSDAVGVEKIFLCGITPAPLDRFGNPNSRMLKVSLGAEEMVEWESVKSTAALLKRLKKSGYTILALELDKKSILYTQAKLSKKSHSKTALLLGGEVKGLSPALLRHVDQILEIPMRGQKESLNVSVAYGIVVYHLLSLGSDI